MPASIAGLSVGAVLLATIIVLLVTLVLPKTRQNKDCHEKNEAAAKLANGNSRSAFSQLVSAEQNRVLNAVPSGVVSSGVPLSTAAIAPPLPVQTVVSDATALVDAPVYTTNTSTTPTLQQAFQGTAPRSITKRQATDTFQVESILPSSFRTAASSATPADATLVAQSDNASVLLSMLAPKREDLLNATERQGCLRVSPINSRSARSRIIGQTSLLRPPAPIPCSAATSAPTFHDSDQRHYAVQTQSPPIVASV